MNQSQKDVLRQKSQEHIVRVQNRIEFEKNNLTGSVSQLTQVIKGALKGSHDEDNTDIEKILIMEKSQRLDELNKLNSSPYFSKCLVKFDRDSDYKTVYFGKFAFFAESIFSWTSPIARLRFDDVGKFEYFNEDDFPVKGQLDYKEQYMIIDGHIVFMAVEGKGQPRELVYQERLTRKKSEFSLPEIVEQMEKAQDEVIRANWKGSFLISGPAGSGKTTLALHRVAYLTQAPETETNFPSDKIIVFVQDASTKAYFSLLLPELGIKKVLITTFDEWLIEKLKLKNITFVQKYGRNEDEKDLLEWAKNKALKKLSSYFDKLSDYNDPYALLEEAYAPFFSEELRILFRKQSLSRVIDRFDLSLLGKLKIKREGGLSEPVVQYELLKRMRSKKTVINMPTTYSLIVVDEAENFLQEQIEILISCKSKKTQAILYVGDLAQQTRAYTIKKWGDVAENFDDGRKVVLYKVYRNTKQILQYIEKVGFSTTIPEGIQEGKEVGEYILHTKAQEIEKVEQLLDKNSEGVVGILAKSDEYLEIYRKIFLDNKNVKIMTINESQGVEFDKVFLVGVESQYFGGLNFEYAYLKERRHVDHDLLYVALTRAMNELYVLGREKLSDILITLKSK
ncbi:MAG: AAA family ATPase [bacterium]|nr:AAA family ATPase [bacterium]